MAILTFEFEMKANYVNIYRVTSFLRKKERERDGEAYRQTAINDDDDDDLTMLIGPLRQNGVRIRGWGSIKILVNDWSR